MTAQINDPPPYRGPSAIAPPSKSRFNLMLWIERFFMSSKVSVSIKDDKVLITWPGQSFLMNRSSAVEFRDWLISQPDDAPIAWEGCYNENKSRPLTMLMDRGYVRSFQSKFCTIATAIERRLAWK